MTILSRFDYFLALEKAQILVQLEKTEAVRDDLTKEVS